MFLIDLKDCYPSDIALSSHFLDMLQDPPLK